MLEESMAKILNVKELQAKIAKAQADKAAAEMTIEAKARAEKKALIDRLSQPSGLSDEDALEKAAVIINRALENNLTSVEVLRFPNHLCTDNGRAINQAEAGWEKTLTGLPKEIYAFWQRQLEPQGYRIRYHIADYVGGMPGDVLVTLSWDA
jgi:hypothetical protein